MLSLTGPIIQLPGVYFFRVEKEFNGNPPKAWQVYSIEAGWDLTGLSQFISGIILVTGVLRIRNFFSKRNATEFINTGMLLRHAAAFGIYLLCCTIYFGTHTLHSLNATNLFLWNLFLFGGVFGYTGSAIA